MSSLTVFRCPTCEGTLDVRSGAATAMAEIGPSEVRCPHCGTSVSTGAKPWHAFSPSERRRFWLRFWFGDALKLAVLCGAGTAMLVAGSAAFFGLPSGVFAGPEGAITSAGLKCLAGVAAAAALAAIALRYRTVRSWTEPSNR